ncbi:hypothetical protein ABT086_24040 [Streptomyces mirabilis]
MGEETLQRGVQVRGVRVGHGAGLDVVPQPVQVFLYFAQPREVHQLLEFRQEA